MNIGRYQNVNKLCTHRISPCQGKKGIKMYMNKGVDKEQVIPVHNGIITLPGQNELMSFAIIEINLEIITVSEVRSRKRNII